MESFLWSIAMGVCITAQWLAFQRGRKWREHPALRLLLTAASMMVFALVWGAFNWEQNLQVEIIIAGLLTLAGCYCFYIDAFTALYSAVWTTMCGEIVYESVSALSLFWLDLTLQSVQFYILCVSVVLLASLAVALIVPYLSIREPTDSVAPRQTLFAVVVLFLFVELYVSMMQRAQMLGPRGSYATLVMVQLYCMTFLYFQNQMFRKIELQKELDTMTIILDQKQLQYKQAKQNILRMNQYCHTLKQNISKLKKQLSEAERNRLLDNLESSVNDYSVALHTGNEVLDIVLTEKTLLFRTRGITLSCIADGRLLQSIKHTEIYTLFSLLLDMAFNEVSALQEEEKRLVDLNICQRQNYIVIQLFYPVNGELSAEQRKAHRSHVLKAIEKIAADHKGMIDLREEHEQTNFSVMIPQNQ